MWGVADGICTDLKQCLLGPVFYSLCLSYLDDVVPDEPTPVGTVVAVVVVVLLLAFVVVAAVFYKRR